MNLFIRKRSLKPFTLYLTKRYMETSTASSSSTTPNLESVQQETTVNQVPALNNLENVHQRIELLGREILGEDQVNQIKRGTSNKEVPRDNGVIESNFNSNNSTTILPEYTLSKEARVIDTILKSIVSDTEEIAERLGYQINKSAELATKWKELLHKCDEYIKNLSQYNLSNMVKYGAYILTLGIFLYNMAITRSIPNFLWNLISPSTLSEVGHSVLRDTKPSNFISQNTFDTLMETPLTPLAITTSVGLGTLAIGVLKIVVFVLRRR